MLKLFFDDIVMVLLVGIVIGAGLPAIFAVGIRSLAYGTGGDAEVTHEAGHPIGKLVGYLCFAIVLAVIAMGITIVVSGGFGYTVDFSHVIPAFHKK